MAPAVCLQAAFREIYFSYLSRIAAKRDTPAELTKVRWVRLIRVDDTVYTFQRRASAFDFFPSALMTSFSSHYASLIDPFGSLAGQGISENRSAILIAGICRIGRTHDKSR